MGFQGEIVCISTCRASVQYTSQLDVQTPAVATGHELLGREGMQGQLEWTKKTQGVQCENGDSHHRTMPNNLDT